MSGTGGTLGLVTVVGGNTGSVRQALRRIGVEPRPVATPADLAACDAAILPGVGAFAHVMHRLRAARLDEALRAHVGRDRPLLGICVGMQVLADAGDEGGEMPGLGLVSGRVRRLPADGVRVPHVGWNDVEPATGDAEAADLLTGGRPAADFYFVHAYVLEPSDPAHVAATSEHGVRFASVVRHGPVLGVQFHPEKSQRAGLELLERFHGLVAA